MSGHLTPTPPSTGNVPATHSPGGEVGAYHGGVGGPEEKGVLKERLRRYLASIWRFKLVILVLALLGGVAGAAMLWSAQSEYTASARLWVNTDEAGGGNQGPIRSPELLRASGWTDLLTSPLILEPAVYEQRLYLGPDSVRASPAFANLEVTNDVVPGRYTFVMDENGGYDLRDEEENLVENGRAGDVVGRSAGFSWTPNGVQPGEKVTFSLVSPRAATHDLGARVASRTQGGGSFLRIEYTGSDPVAAAAIVNSIAERYVEVAADLKRARLDELEEIILEQLEYSEANLRETESALESFRINTITLPSDRGPAPGVEMTTDPVLREFFALNSERDQLRRDRETLQRALGQVGDGGLSLNVVEVIPSVRNSSALPTALSELNSKQAEYRLIRERYTEQHPEAQRVRREIDELENEVIPAIGSRLIREMAQREGELGGRVASSASELQQIPPRAIEEARLERSVAIAGNIYTTVRQRYEQARLAAETAIPDLRLLDQAHPPREPTEVPGGFAIVLAGLLAGLSLGVVGAAGWTHVDPKIRFPDEVTRGLGVPLLGIVPDMTRTTRRSEAHITVQAVEAFREIRLNVWHSHGRSDPLMLTVTSPGAGDGKSFVSANMSLAFADAGFRTLLIDGDLRRGTLHGLLGAERKPGLTDYLLGRADQDRIVQTLRQSPLHFIGCGTMDRKAAERLGSSQMMRLLSNLRAEYDVIILDSPPVGAGADAYTLATITGNLLFVMRAGMANRDFVNGKLDVLDRLPVRLLGSVLNAVSMHRFEGYFPYVSGYETIDEADYDPFAGNAELAEDRKRVLGTG